MDTDASPEICQPVDALDRAFGRLAAVSAEILRLIPGYADWRVWARDGASSISQWLARRYRLRKGMARELVRMARALESLPEIAESHATARLSLEQIQPLTKFATAETDALWARRAPEMSAAALWREWERHQRITSKDSLQLHAMRSLYLRWDEDRPLLYVDGILPGEQGEAFEKAGR